MTTTSAAPANIAVSVIIATCNRPDLAYRAACRVLEQSAPDVQVIVVNNGSSLENQAHYCQLFDMIEHRIDYVDLCTQKAVGVGPSVARNVGIAYARGDYVTFCDDDDEWTDPDYLASLLPVLQRYRPAMVFADQQALRADRSVMREHWFDRESLIGESQPVGEEGFYEVTPEYFYQHGGFAHLNITLYQTELLQRYGGFCQALDYEEDFELFHRLMSHASHVFYYDKVVSLHHIPNPKKRNNVTTQMSLFHKQLARIYIFNKFVMESPNQRLTRFATTHGSYAAGRIAEEALRLGNFSLAKTMARQALSWRLSPSMVKVWWQAWLGNRMNHANAYRKEDQ